MTDREITYIPLVDLQEDPRNPKAHDHEAITSSLERFSVIDPIALDGRTGYIISGHGRREALLAMEARGDAPPEGITLSPDGGWLVPVVTGWSSRTDAEARAALIALNRTGELGGWVDDSLLALLDELSAADPELPLGFTDEDRETLRRLTEADAYLHPTPQRWDVSDLDDHEPLPSPPGAGSSAPAAPAGLSLPSPPSEGTPDPVNLGAYRTLIVRVSDEESYLRLTEFIGTALRQAAGNGTESYWYGPPPEQGYDASRSASSTFGTDDAAAL